MAGTMNLADLYGIPSVSAPSYDPTTPQTGGNQGSVAPMAGSGVAGGAAFSWLGFVLLLVVLRVLWEMAE